MSQNVSRRTLAKGAAWTVPAVAVAAAAPMVAASPIVTVTKAGSACKLPGGSCGKQGWTKGYLQPLEICNKSNTDTITVTIDASTLSFNGVDKAFTPNPSEFTLAKNECQRVILNINLEDNSKDSSISGKVHWHYVATPSGQSDKGETDISTGSTPPCSNCTV